MSDIAGNATTTATIGVGSTLNGDLEVVGDHDWYKITLAAGQSVVVTIHGITLEDSYLNIRDSAGNIIFSNDDIVDGVVRDSKVSFSPTYSGTYYVDVGAWNDAYPGTYSVSVQPYTPPPLATNDQVANQLTSGYWGGDVHHFDVTPGGTISVNISSLTPAEQTLARTALSEWSDIIGVHFQEVATGGQIQFDHSEDPNGPIAATDANWSNGIISSAHVHISSSWVNQYGTSLYSYSFQTYVHEIGHALGLGHAGDYNNTATYPYDALFQNDAWSTSVMSYFDQHENSYYGGQGFTVDFAVTPMVADILAMQTLYGLSTTTRTGDTTYGFHSNAGGVYDASAFPKAGYTIFDDGGTDLLDFSGSAASQSINLNPETFSSVDGNSGNLSIARGVIIENAIGGSGADTIIGNSAANVLTGGTGADRLSGGTGNDSFVDTKAGHNGDTITDFSAGDKIVITDATLSGFSFSVSGNTLSYSGGAMTLASVPSGTIVASAALGGGVQLALIGTGVHNDFNGDGRSDVLWRNDSGNITDWLGATNGGFAINDANAATGAVGNSWHVIGTGDFNGDGRTDLMWRNDNGVVTDWLGQASGGFADNGSNFTVNPGSSWHLAGTGDFNGDGNDDLLWRNDNGQVTEWLAQPNGAFADNAANFSVNPGISWHVAATGDFNGDGRDDIVWRNDNGQVSGWLGQSSGKLADNSANFFVNPGTSWHVVGSGDFNGDGFADILWRNDNGQVTDWLGHANGSMTDNASNFSMNPGTSWHVVGTDDFNGDGRSDILWRNDNGTTTDWLGQSNGAMVDNSANLFVNPGAPWHVQDASVHDPFPFA